MSKKVGRKDKYFTHVLPRLKDIEKWLDEGADQRLIAQKLGVSYSAWNQYKVKYEELKAVCDKPREGLIADLRSALIKKALGFTYEIKKQYITEKDGVKTKHTEVTTMQSLPDTTAIFGALNLYDSDYVKDRKNYELRQQELELRKQMAEEEKNKW